MDTPLDNLVDAVPPQDTPANEGKESEGLPSPSSYVPPPPKGDSERCECRPDQTPWWKHALEISAVLVGIAVAIIYWRQLDTMKGQLDQMIKQYPQLEKSATAAKSAADTARDALDIQTRPWVNLVISGIKISGKEGAEAQLRYSVDAALMNSGIHPALKAGFAFVQDPVEGQEGLLYNETKCSAARNEVEEHNAKSVTPVANIIFPGESGKQVLSAYPVGFKSIFSAGTRVHIIGCVWYYGRDPKDMHRTVVRYVGTPKSFEVGTTLSDFTLEYANAQ